MQRLPKRLGNVTQLKCGSSFGRGAAHHASSALKRFEDRAEVIDADGPVSTSYHNPACLTIPAQLIDKLGIETIKQTSPSTAGRLARSIQDPLL
jgi:hypothetical protein